MTLERIYCVCEAALSVLHRAILNVKTALHNGLTSFTPELIQLLRRFGNFFLYHYLVPFFVSW